MTTIHDVLRRPIITEKSNYLNSKLNQYAFEVAPGSSKTLIKDAVELLFDVSVLKVNVILSPAKRTRRPRNRQLKIRRSGYKKAIVTLAPGNTIEIFEGVK